MRLAAVWLALAAAGCATRGVAVNGVEIREGKPRRALEPQMLARRSAAAVGVITTDVGRGMAFVIDPRGYLITNRHVIEDADHVQDLVFPALDPPLRFTAVRVVYIDGVHDLALLEVDPDRPLPALALATASQRPAHEYTADDARIMVLSQRSASEAPGADAIGLAAHPGIIEALDVQNPAAGPGPYLGLSSDVRHGQSGGPVVDHFGRAVGVVTWTWKDRTGGYAIPIGQATQMLAERPRLESTNDHRARIRARADEFLLAMREGEFDRARRLSSPSHARAVRGHTVSLLLDSVPPSLVRAYVDGLEDLVESSRRAGDDPFEDLRAVIARTGSRDLAEQLGVERQLTPRQVTTFFFELGQAYIAARVFGGLALEDSAEAAIMRLHSLDAARSFVLAEIVDSFPGRSAVVERIEVFPGEYAPRAVVTVAVDGRPLVLQMRLEWGDWYVAEVFPGTGHGRRSRDGESAPATGIGVKSRE